MNKEAVKARYERLVFQQFLGLQSSEMVLSEFSNGDVKLKEPDIVGKFLNGDRVGFELGRITNTTLAHAARRQHPSDGAYFRTGDISYQIAKKKLSCVYTKAFPVELILYKENPIVSPDTLIIESIRPALRPSHPFQRVWFMGSALVLMQERLSV